MNYLPEIPDVSQWDHYDLMDYNDLRLTSAGELELSASRPVDAILKLGHNVLSLSSLASGQADPHSGRPLQLYIIRNLTATSDRAVTTLDTTRRRNTAYSVENGRFIIQQPLSLTIGRALDATPELDLDSSASRHHTHLRIGNLASHLHISDLYSTNGTHVYLNPNVEHGLTYPTRHFKIDPTTFDITTFEARNQRWTRD